MNSLYEDELFDSWRDLKEAREMQLVNIADVLFTERMKNRLREWHDRLLRDRNGKSEFQGSLNDSKQQFQTIFCKMRPAVSLNGFTSHQLKLIQSVVNKHFKDLVYVRVSGENSCSQQLVVYTDSDDDKKLFMKEMKDERNRDIEMKIRAAIGFRHVIDCLSSEKKLIVGHNCFLDVAHIYDKFLGALPLTAEEFISSVNKYFPHIIDTKILLNSNNLLLQRMKKSSTSLSSAFSILCPQSALGSKSSHLLVQQRVKVEVEVDDMRSSNWNSGVKHEAGYDAFMTGCVFAQACSHLGIDFTLHSSSENLALNEKLQKHINLLYLSWTNGDIINLSTGKRSSLSLVSSNKKYQYPLILFSHIVLIWGFPSKLKAWEIRECISKALGSTSVTTVYHIDETAVFVQFRKKEMVPQFLELKESLEKSNDTVLVLHPLAKLLEGGNTRASSYEIYKEICSSPISKVLFADQAAAVGIKWKTKLVESKVEVGAQDNSKSSNAEHSLNSGENTNDPLPGQASSGEIDDDLFYAAQIKQI
ncbi:poly(A)-specific ribonuclease PARN isoform X2 [Mangifera indica]|nr:poly(A)-specific ribonuclease PARN isoform X2 [Mangifera indica]